MKTMLMQNFGVTNKEHYGILWYFLEWSIGFGNNNKLTHLNWDFGKTLKKPVHDTSLIQTVFSKILYGFILLVTIFLVFV